MKRSMFEAEKSAGKKWMTVLLLQVLMMLLLVAPANAGINEWETNGPYGGDARAIAIDPIYPATVYVGFNDRGGIYKSTNGGETWSSIGSGLMDSSIFAYGVYSIAIDPVTPTTLYAATSSRGVFKSTNGGSNWQQASNGITDLFVHTVAIHPSNSNVIYAGGGGSALFRSMNGGNSWQNINIGLKDPVYQGASVYVNQIVINPKAPDTIYLGTYSGVFKSINGGDSWASTNIGLPQLGVAALELDPKNPMVLYAGVGDGVFKSSDGGASWSAVNAGLPAKGGYINATVIKVDPINTSTIYTVINSGLFKSSNGGESWSQLTSDTRVNELAIDPVTPSTLYMGTYATGIVKSIDNGNHWDVKSSGLTGSITTAVVQDPNIPTTIYAGDNGKGVLKSTNGGGSWSSSSIGLSDLSVISLAIDSATPSTLYAGNGGGVFRSTNSGDSWSLVGKILVSGTVDFVRALAVDPTVPSTIYAATYYGVFKSVNRGDSWNKISIDLPDTYIETLVVDPRDSQVVYAGTQLGVFKSTNGGANWKQMYVGMKDPSYYLFVVSIAIDPVNTGTIYAATEHGVFKSINGGDSWVSSSANVWMSTILIHPINRNFLYASTGQSFWVSTNGGESWSYPQTNETGGFGIGAFAIASAEPSTIYAATDGGGVYSMTIVDTTSTFAKPRGAAYVSAQDVSLYSNRPATIYYTTDGSDPTSSPTRHIYTGSIHISSDTALKFYGVDSNGIAGPQSTASYQIDSGSPVTTPSPGAGIYTSSQSVALVCSDGTGSGCATTYYCLGTNCTPTTPYTGPVPISSTDDLRYYSSDNAGNRETIKTSRLILTDRLGGFVTVSITGSGSVHGTSTFGENFSCATATCPSTQYAYDDQAVLMATDSVDYHFEGWSGDCTATSGACILAMTADRNVTATFTLVSQIRLYTQSGIHDYGTLADAYAGIPDDVGNTIACREASLTGDLVLDRPVTLLVKGGYDVTFGSNTFGTTALQGVLIVRQGSLTVENMVLR